MLIYASAFDLFDVTATLADLVATEPSNWSASDVNACSIVEDGKYSSRALNVSDDDGYAILEASLAAETETVLVHAWVKPTSLQDAELLRFFASPGVMLRVDMLSTGAVRALSTGSITVATSAANVLVPGEWNLLEVRAQHSTNARVRVRVNGNDVIDAQGADTEGATGDLDSVGFGGTSDGVLWSDLMVMDGSGHTCNDMLGPNARAVLLYPIGPTGSSVDDDWTTTTSPQASALTDKIPGGHDGDGTHLEATAYDIRAVFLHSKLSPDHHDVQAVTAIYAAEGTDPLVAPILASGLIESTGAAFTLAAVGGGYRHGRYAFPKDPGTGQRWKTDRVNALRVGVLALEPPP